MSQNQKYKIKIKTGAEQTRIYTKTEEGLDGKVG